MNAPLGTIIRRALRLRCPACGEGRLYVRWNILREHCPQCACMLQRREEEGWFFIYMTTAGLTGVLIVAMLLIDVPDILMGQVAVLVAWFVVIFASLPVRKSLAIGIDFYLEVRSRKGTAGGHPLQ